MFKIKPTKKSTTTLTSIISGLNQTSQKQRISLQQNDDFLNVGLSQQHNEREKQDVQIQKIVKDKIKRNGSLIRPGSGLNRNLMRASTIKNDSVISDEQLIQQKIKQKAMQRLRPSTSSNPTQNTITLKQKKHRLLNRKGNFNSTNHSINIPKPNKLPQHQNIQSQREINTQRRSDMYVSNQEVLQIIECTLLKSQEYMSFKQMNEQQFQRIRQRLVSNVSIMVLKWHKTIQDRLYNQVRSITASTTFSQPIPQTVQQLINQQIKRQFIKYSDLFRIEQQCNSRQSRVQQLINGRLSKLQWMLCSKNAVAVVGR